MQRKFGIAVVAALIATPAALQAQGLVGGAQGGAQRGAAQGDALGGPIGGVVGGVVGGATGAATGVLGLDQAPQFRDYALREHRSSFRFDRQLQPGERLPLSGVTYYPVPKEYGVDPRYRYTVVNDHAVIVDPQTRRIVQVID
ncbi:protein of unknown function DUF1236 [Methylocella silvestris BL2]|uniref:DUF1236 domain-containing protein n=1 Tax=Methylocella silvestris (strain DSM 15510 / CIP 108128 / LMG 27833 / NCIMB 13906 / BL2) TaxID=395965 RepID=B8EN00_METSB|nr:DUF1236 domain-containing protein [Methylocella silvestris]ACK49135.1 protein of unknown function DUF1236 [Methylocella silvestris BL2]